MIFLSYLFLFPFSSPPFFSLYRQLYSVFHTVSLFFPLEIYSFLLFFLLICLLSLFISAFLVLFETRPITDVRPAYMCLLLSFSVSVCLSLSIFLLSLSNSHVIFMRVCLLLICIIQSKYELYNILPKYFFSVN